MDPQNAQAIAYGISLVLIAVVLALRFRRLTRKRRLRLEVMWILPAILIAATAAVMMQFPPHGLGWVWIAAATAAGGAAGWWRGKTMTITVDPQTHVLNQRASAAGLIIFAAIVAARMGLRALLSAEAEAWHIDLNLVTDGMMAFLAGMYALMRLEMFIRARGLLAEARAKRA